MRHRLVSSATHILSGKWVGDYPGGSDSAWRPHCAACSVRFWEQNGSGGTLSTAVRCGHRARLEAADVRERHAAVGSPSWALSSHRGGQGFKSPQLHRVLAGQVACSSFWLFVGEPMWEPSRTIWVSRAGTLITMTPPAIGFAGV